MKLKASIKQLSLAALISALITVILILGTFLDILDLACVSLSAIIIAVMQNILTRKYIYLIYTVSSALSLILIPLRSCSLMFVFFFGYYPVLRKEIYRYIKTKKLCLFILFAVYNLSMALLFTVFKSIFGIYNEPAFMYIILIIVSNVFFFVFELLMSRIHILYEYKIKKLFKK